MPAKDYRDFVAWKKAFALALTIYRETSCFPKYEKYGLRSQFRRACISIPSNIAEGEGRNVREFLRFLSIALDSLREVETQILIPGELRYLRLEQVTVLMEMSAEVGRLINSLSRSLRNPR